MRNILIALVLVAPLASHAAPNAAFHEISARVESLALQDTGLDATRFADQGESTSAPLDRMALSTAQPGDGTTGALADTMNGDASTDLLDVALDDAMDAAVGAIPLAFATLKLPPLAGAWLGGLSRPPALLPEPFSYSILSIGLLGFIISRFRRAA